MLWTSELYVALIAEVITYSFEDCYVLPFSEGFPAFAMSPTMP